MSCVTGFGDGDHWKRAKSQRLRFSMPQVTDSKLARVRAMAESDDLQLRAVAAGHALATPGMLLSLAIDPEWFVRACVVKNPLVQSAVLEWIANHDEEPTIRAAAKFELERRAERVE